MKKYVYMVKFDWSVEDDCDVEIELFFNYEKALEKYDQIIADELNPNLSWVGSLAINSDGNVEDGYTLDKYGSRLKQENLFWSCVMDDDSNFYSTIHLLKMEIK